MQLFYFLFHTKVDTKDKMYTVGTNVKAIGEHSGKNRRTGTVDNKYILHWPHVYYHAEKYKLRHCKV